MICTNCGAILRKGNKSRVCSPCKFTAAMEKYDKAVEHAAKMDKLRNAKKKYGKEYLAWYQREYKKANRDKIRAADKRYREAHRELRRKRDRDRYLRLKKEGK